MAMKPLGKPGLEDDSSPIHRIRITLTSRNVKNLEKGAPWAHIVALPSSASVFFYPYSSWQLCSLLCHRAVQRLVHLTLLSLGLVVQLILCRGSPLAACALAAA